MTLSVTSDEIQILNSQGQKKFSSKEPLLFLASYEFGNSAIGRTGDLMNGSPIVRIPLDKEIKDDEIVILYITITSTNMGSPSSSLVNLRQPANAVIPLRIDGYANGNTPNSRTTTLSIAPSGRDELTASMIVYPSNGSIQVSTYDTGVSAPLVNFKYEVYKYRYLR